MFFFSRCYASYFLDLTATSSNEKCFSWEGKIESILFTQSIVSIHTVQFSMNKMNSKTLVSAQRGKKHKHRQSIQSFKKRERAESNALFADAAVACSFVA